MTSAYRAKIFVESAGLLSKTMGSEGQIILRLRAPQCAMHARAGQFIFLQCANSLAMRRPYSIMRVDRKAGWIELYLRIVGEGSALLAQHQEGDLLSIMGPIGTPFTLSKERKNLLLLGGGVGMPPIVFLAHELCHDSTWKPFVLLASERSYPFEVCASSHTQDALSVAMPATLKMLEDIGVVARLCSTRQSFPGCLKGRIDHFAEQWLENLTVQEKAQTEVFACGPKGMLQTIARLAKAHQIKCQLCIEEFMACAVGGCAGCAIRTQHKGQISMRRVCVDGPVFHAHELCDYA
ncbi:MAG: FAD-binding oxidoreductase [Candidatus Oxydemutatoraceae bacterium WSBS_2016_MAG_OTU14]